MLKPGTLVGDALEVGSMAHAIESCRIASKRAPSSWQRQ